MMHFSATLAACVWITGSHAFASPSPADPRLREVTYSAQTVVSIPVRRGVVTHIMLDEDESILEVAAGLGADCARAETAWCVAAQAGNRHLFVKPKSTATAANNLAVVTSRRVHAFRLEVLSDADTRPAVFRLMVRAPQPSAPNKASLMTAAPRLTAGSWLEPITDPMLSKPAATKPNASSSRELVAERLKAKPQALNTRYSFAEGDNSQDIVPTLVFDDGRFTYLKFPGNRELPAIFHVLGDGGEALLNTRMEDDLLVIDRVARRLMLRAGNAVVGLWNDAFDLEGKPPMQGTTVPGIERALKSSADEAMHTPPGVAP